MQKFIAHLSYESLTLVSRPDSVETQNKETKTRAVKKVQNASDFKVFLDFEVFHVKVVSSQVSNIDKCDYSELSGCR